MAEQPITKADWANAARRSLTKAMAKVRITQGQRETIVARSRLPEIAAEQLVTSSFRIAHLRGLLDEALDYLHHDWKCHGVGPMAKGCDCSMPDLQARIEAALIDGTGCTT